MTKVKKKTDKEEDIETEIDLEKEKYIGPGKEPKMCALTWSL